MMASTKKLRVLFPLHPGFDLMDVFGPMEIFSLAGEPPTGILSPTSRPFEIVTAGEQSLVESTPGLKVEARISMKEAYDSIASFDIIVVPGGNSNAILEEGHKEPMGIIAAFARVAPQSSKRIIMTVCTGALFLAKAGVLEGHTATTNTNDLHRLRAMVVGRDVIVAAKGERFVVNPTGGRNNLHDCRVMTSAGPGAGLELALWLVGELVGAAVAEGIEKLTEFQGQTGNYLILEGT